MDIKFQIKVPAKGDRYREEVLEHVESNAKFQLLSQMVDSITENETFVFKISHDERPCWDTYDALVTYQIFCESLSDYRMNLERSKPPEPKVSVMGRIAKAVNYIFTGQM